MENSRSFEDIPEAKRTRKDLLTEALRRNKLRIDELTNEGRKRTATEDDELWRLRSEQMTFKGELETLERKQ